jgi:hypothetical protein
VAKFVTTRGLTIDNMESSWNHGPGLWLDGRNTNFTIKNGYFHDNDDYGVDLEINWGPGSVTGSTFARNGTAGLTLTNTGNVAVRDNLFAYEQYPILSTYVDRGTAGGVQMFPVANNRLVSNTFAEWVNFSAIHHHGALQTSPAAQNITADSNTYDPGPITRLAWYSGTVRKGATTIAHMQSYFGWEAAGTLAPVTLPVLP